MNEKMPAVGLRPDYEAAVMAYIGACTARGAAAANTITSYKRGISDFCAWLGKDPREANQADIENWRAAMLAEGKKHRTVMVRLAAVRTLYKALRRAGVCDSNPAEYVEAPKPEKAAVDAIMGKLVFPDQMLLVLSKISPDTRGLRDRALLLVMYILGLRMAEAAGLDCGDFGGDTITFRSKGGQTRELTVPAPLKTVLAEFLAGRSEGPMFLGDGGRYTPRGIQKMVAARMAAAGLTHKSPHCMRHSAATVMAINGATLYAIQDQLGHANPKTTGIYTQVAGRFLDAPSNLMAKALGM